MKTKLAKNTNWPGKTPASKKSVNLEDVKKTRDAYAPERMVKRHKYDEMFKNLQEGDCFCCPDADTMAAVSRALRVYIKRQGWDGVVRQNERTEDGIFRVWAVKVIKNAP